MKAVPLTFRCTSDWDRMTPRAGGRFCGDCKKIVHNLTAMGEEAAEVFLRANAKGDICVRYAANAEGTMLFAPTQQPLIPSSLLDRAKRVAVAASLALPLAGCSSEHAGGDRLVAAQMNQQDVDAGPVTDEPYEWVVGDPGWSPEVVQPNPTADAGADSGADADAGTPDAAHDEHSHDE